MNTEIIATSTLKQSIAQTKTLIPFVNEGDKEPTWDGFIYIIADENIGYRRRVPVQVKGKESIDLTKKEITYSIEVSKLKDFLYDGGVIYFVVYISNEGLATKIYYVSLLPLKIQTLLSELKKDQKKKSIELKSFPMKNDDKLIIFTNFYEHSIKQTSFVNTKLLSLDELEKQGSLESITVSVNASKIYTDPIEAFLNEDVYLYANLKGSNTPHPIEMLDFIEFARQNLIKVYSNGEKYYDNITLIRSKGRSIFKIGDSITISCSTNSQKYDVKYTPTLSLRNRAVDLRFMISILEVNSFELEGYGIFNIPFDANSLDFDINNQKQFLSYYEKIIQALNILNVKEDLILENLTYHDKKNIYYLVKAFVDKKPVEGLKPNLLPFLRLKIGNLKLMLSFIKSNDNETTYYIYDFFKTEFKLFYLDEKGKERITSQYSVLEKNDFLEISNMDLDKILPSYKKIEGNEVIFERANFTMLNLLLAYDECENKQILSICKSVDQWIIDEDKINTIPYNIKLLNHLQIIRRERELDLDENGQLCNIIEQNSDNREDIITGSYLLLDNQVAAEIHFNKLEKSLQEEFKKYPIFKFWKNK